MFDGLELLLVVDADVFFGEFDLGRRGRGLARGLERGSGYGDG